MKSVTIILAVAGHAYAFPAYGMPKISERALDAYPWIPVPVGGGLHIPQKPTWKHYIHWLSAVRAPCPGHNTLANHGFINRDGRNITKAAIQQGFLDAFGFDFGVTSPGADSSLSLCSMLTSATCNSFDLDQLSTPHAIEHDASLTRDDAKMGFNVNADNHSFNQTIWNRSLAIYGPATHIDMQMAANALRGRQVQARQEDAPGWYIENTGGASTEAAFYLYAMNDPTNSDYSNPLARLDWVNYWFGRCFFTAMTPVKSSFN